MNIILKKKPNSPTIIEGFPGFGLVGTIATEFLIDHLETEMIGKIELEDQPAIVAIHESKIVQPLGIFYNKKYNLVILHAVGTSDGIEWKIADIINELAKRLGAKEIISLEGVGSQMTKQESTRTFYFTKNSAKDKMLSKITDPLKEGIIMGVTGALLLKSNTSMTCIFAETHTQLPDSKAAAQVITVLDKYLGLKVDTKPLLEQAEKFEEKLQGILSKSKKAEELSEKKKLSYVG